MGIFDTLSAVKRAVTPSDVQQARAAMDEARATNGDTDAITSLIQKILSLGLDGRGFYKGSQALADAALKEAHGNRERAVESVGRQSVRSGAAAGFVTSLGGFVTMPVAIPANVFEFYVQATRAAGAVAVLRGYDIKDQTVRTAVLLTLVGSNAADVLSKAGVSVASTTVTGLAEKQLPKAAVMMIQKAVGFRVLRSVGEKTLSRFGRLVPVLGGGIGAVADGAMMSRIVNQARSEFPATVAGRAV